MGRRSSSMQISSSCYMRAGAAAAAAPGCGAPRSGRPPRQRGSSAAAAGRTGAPATWTPPAGTCSAAVTPSCATRPRRPHQLSSMRPHSPGHPDNSHHSASRITCTDVMRASTRLLRQARGDVPLRTTCLGALQGTAAGRSARGILQCFCASPSLNGVAGRVPAGG